MSVAYHDPSTRKQVRMLMWVDQIIKNLEKIETQFDNKNYSTARKELAEQYRLIALLWSISKGKTKLQGWKVDYE